MKYQRRTCTLWLVQPFLSYFCCDFTENANQIILLYNSQNAQISYKNAQHIYRKLNKTYEESYCRVEVKINILLNHYFSPTLWRLFCCVVSIWKMQKFRHIQKIKTIGEYLLILRICATKINKTFGLQMNYVKYLFYMMVNR